MNRCLQFSLVSVLLILCCCSCSTFEPARQVALFLPPTPPPPPPMPSVQSLRAAAALVVPIVTNRWYIAATAQAGGLESDFSNEVSFATTNRTLVAPVLAWDASPGTNVVTNYTLYYGPASGFYSNTASAGTNLTMTLWLLAPKTNRVVTISANTTNWAPVTKTNPSGNVFVRAVATKTTGTTESGIVGNIADGTQTDYMWDNGPWINACRFRASSNMTVTAMRAKVVGIRDQYKCAIYTDIGGQPSRLLGSTDAITNSTTGWKLFPLNAPVGLTNGQYCWLAIWSDSPNALVYRSGTGALRYQRVDYGAWPDSLATTGGSTFNYCIYGFGDATTTAWMVAAQTAPSLSGPWTPFTPWPACDHLGIAAPEIRLSISKRME